MNQVHIIIDEIVKSQDSLNWFEIIKDIVGLLSTFMTIWVMLVGICTINRLHLKGEEAVFNFFSRLTVYLVLLKDSIGTPQKSIYYYMFTDDIRRERFLNQTPTQEDLDEFKKLSVEILDFLKDADNQFAITEEYYLRRKDLINFLVCKGKKIGETHPFTSDNIDIEDKIDETLKIIDSMISEIDRYTKKTLSRHWKKNKV